MNEKENEELIKFLEEKRIRNKAKTEKFALMHSRKRASEKGLPDDLTLFQKELISRRFNRCPITGSLNTHEEHFVAISSGQGEGHSIRNLWRLDCRINIWKSDSNPFEFFRREDVIDEIISEYGRTRQQIESSFESVVEYLANQNDMTARQFEAYTNFCFTNRKSDKEIEEIIEAGQTVNSRKEFERGVWNE